MRKSRRKWGARVLRCRMRRGKSRSESEENGAFAVVATLPPWFFVVLRRDFNFLPCGKRGVRFFTHASRRKNLKRGSGARRLNFYTLPPRLRCPTSAPSRGGLSPLPALCSDLRSRSGRCGPARFGGLPPVPASGSAPVLRSAFPHFSERSRARCFAAVIPPRSFGARVSRATLF